MGLQNLLILTTKYNAIQYNFPYQHIAINIIFIKITMMSFAEIVSILLILSGSI